MSTLRSALEELNAQDPGSLGDEELEEDLGELERATRVIEAVRAARVAEVERRGS